MENDTMQGSGIRWCRHLSLSPRTNSSQRLAEVAFMHSLDEPGVIPGWTQYARFGITVLPTVYHQNVS